MAKFYVEVKEEKKWIFPEIEAVNVQEAGTTALTQTTGTEDEKIKYVSHARVID